MHRWRVPPSFCVVWFARAGVGSLALALVTAGCSSGTAAGGGAAPGRGRGGRGGAQPVVTAKVTQKDVPIDIAAVGNVEAYTTISLRSQVTGQIDEAFFTEGEDVKKGDVLFKIDPRPLESALQASQANETRDQALLKQAEAQLARDASSAEYQRLTAERQEQLVERGIISKDFAEQSRAQADAIAATVNADRAAIESAKAQLAVQQSATESARVQLSYTVIRSPIEGRTGSSTLKVGNLATANQELGTIAQLQPVYVTFTVPAKHLPTIKRHMGADKLLVIATPQDDDKAPASGQLTFVDNVVDTATDTIKLKATFPNTDRRLWPGQFARVSLRLTTLSGATVVPSQAVQTGQDGQFVFVVTEDSTVDQRPVTVAQRMNDDAVIEKGVKPGETVITEGQLRLEQGTRVQLSDANGQVQGGGRGGRGRGGRGQDQAQSDQSRPGDQGGQHQGGRNRQ